MSGQACRDNIAPFGEDSPDSASRNCRWFCPRRGKEEVKSRGRFEAANIAFMRIWPHPPPTGSPMLEFKKPTLKPRRRNALAKACTRCGEDFTKSRSGMRL